jgi:hypothetical protein
VAHAVARCPRASDLSKIQQKWVIWYISQLQYTGPEWFLLTLDNMLENARPVRPLWKNYRVRNDLTYGILIWKFKRWQYTSSDIL